MKTGIKVITKTRTGQVYRIRIYSSIQAARRGVTKQNLEYGAHLEREAIDLATGQRVLVLS